MSYDGFLDLRDRLINGLRGRVERLEVAAVIDAAENIQLQQENEFLRDELERTRAEVVRLRADMTMTEVVLQQRLQETKGGA